MDSSESLEITITTIAEETRTLVGGIVETTPVGNLRETRGVVEVLELAVGVIVEGGVDDCGKSSW